MHIQQLVKSIEIIEEKEKVNNFNMKFKSNDQPLANKSIKLKRANLINSICNKHDPSTSSKFILYISYIFRLSSLLFRPESPPIRSNNKTQMVNSKHRKCVSLGYIFIINHSFVNSSLNLFVACSTR